MKSWDIDPSKTFLESQSCARSCSSGLINGETISCCSSNDCNAFSNPVGVVKSCYVRLNLIFSVIYNFCLIIHNYLSVGNKNKWGRIFSISGLLPTVWSILYRMNKLFLPKNKIMNTNTKNIQDTIFRNRKHRLLLWVCRFMYAKLTNIMLHHW